MTDDKWKEWKDLEGGPAQITYISGHPGYPPPDDPNVVTRAGPDDSVIGIGHADAGRVLSVTESEVVFSTLYSRRLERLPTDEVLEMRRW